MAKIRILIPQKNLQKSQEITIDGDNHHYLANVMRAKEGDEIEIFNGIDGDFLSKIIATNKKSTTILTQEKIKDQEGSSDVIIAFAPVKNVKNDFFAKKGTELNASEFWPILTKRTIIDKINHEKFASNIKEAVEQCERNFVPEVKPIQKLEDLLKNAKIHDKIVIFCNEKLAGDENFKASAILPKIERKNREIVILIGPEGGFDDEEIAKIQNCGAFQISLGKNILRADTAFVAALVLINEFL